ncbi:AraC family transcriptional regulator [Paenibacillus glycanilyticus]|uniref:AraC family transcriptional regulator n=1 Tax=Paenibacillus glycanilyticus TaxID=126569 RepID=A0ABQ6G4F9_9BACL|nr:AraC family transcriptional regulator [Paenibacillus glycanilyticus]GLX65834.1 AraC family transcriptional regulator [Paenibacillus glycanilyticus]
MSELIAAQQSKLAKIIERYAQTDGVHETAIPSMYFMRQANSSGPRPGVYKPSLCLVVQGAKEVWLGEERYKYSPTDYLVSSVHLPVTSQVTEATPDVPYLGFKLEFTAKQVLEVLRDSDIGVGSRSHAKRGMFVSRIETPLMDVIVRLVCLLDEPQDIPMLAPLFIREILYRVLRGEHGGLLEQIAIEGSSTQQIKEVIEHITNYFSNSLRIEELAELANMSISSLHRQFKEVTAMSPIQFQKQLRLQEARRLMISESADASEVAFRVGYESPSQFSREYSRMYGASPRQDVKRLKA